MVYYNNPYTYGPRPVISFISVIFLNSNRRSAVRILSLLGRYGGGNRSGRRFLVGTGSVENICIPSFCGSDCGSSNALGRVGPVGNTPTEIGGTIISSVGGYFCPSSFIIPCVNVIRSETIRRVFHNYVHNYHFYRTNFACHPVERGDIRAVGRRTGTLVGSAKCSRLSLYSLSASSRDYIGRVLSSLVS